MEALEYFVVKKRMCDKVKDCESCPLQYEDDTKTGMADCERLEYEFPEEAISRVEDWLKNNPIRTYRGLLLEKLPNCTLKEEDECIDELMGTNFFENGVCKQMNNCKKCWWQEIKED